MNKVLVERPRRQGDGGAKPRRRKNPPHDLMPAHEGMRAPHVRNWSGKELNENLAPLRRFLHSRVGCKWDEIYGEISKSLRTTNAVQQHVRDHIWDYVATRCFWQDGVLWIAPRRGEPRPLGKQWIEFYVDPDDGLLRHYDHAVEHRKNINQQKQLRQQREQAQVHHGPDGTEYRKVQGIWYEVIWDTVPEPRQLDSLQAAAGVAPKPPSRQDCITGEWHQKPGMRYRCARRQLNHGELRRMSLQNGHVPE
jgi:hypothetical protein